MRLPAVSKAPSHAGPGVRRSGDGGARRLGAAGGRQDGDSRSRRIVVVSGAQGDGGEVEGAVGGTRRRAPVSGRCRRRRSRRRAQDAPGHAERWAPHVGGSRRGGPLRLRPRRADDVQLLRRGVLRPRQDETAPRSEPRRQGLRGPQLGGRRLGPLLHPEARAGARRPQGSQALHLGRRQPSRRNLALGGLQPRAAPFHRDRDGAPDRPRQCPGRPATGGGDLPVLHQRPEHDRPAMAAPPGRDADQQEHLGEDPGRRSAQAARGDSRRRASACSSRSAPAASATSKPCRSGACTWCPWTRRPRRRGSGRPSRCTRRSAGPSSRRRPSTRR